MERFDVVILGGGPAGCSAALCLLREKDPGLSVAIVESRGYAARRIGETLTPGLEGPLGHLGIWQAFLDINPLPAHGTRACWGSDAEVENEFIFHKEGHGWHLDRAAFDQMMASEATRAGGRFFSDNRVVSYDRTDDTWILNLRRGESVACRYVIDGTGRNSSFAVQQGARHIEHDRLTGCFLYFEPAGAPTLDSYTLVEAFEHGWIYSAALPDGSLVAAILSDTDLVRTFEWHSNWHCAIEQTSRTRQRLAASNSIATGEPIVRSASSRQLDPVAGDGWLAVGDAASTFDPLSSQGVQKAIRSGVFASYAILDQIRGNAGSFTRYQNFIGAEYSAYLDLRAAYYGIEQRWPEAPFWKRRQERITLDPSHVLQVSWTDAKQRRMYLTSIETELILEICSQPRAAHQVARELAARSTVFMSPERAVLAVQNALAGGLVEVVRQS